MLMELSYSIRAEKKLNVEQLWKTLVISTKGIISRKDRQEIKKGERLITPYECFSRRIIEICAKLNAGMLIEFVSIRKERTSMWGDG